MGELIGGYTHGDSTIGCNQRVMWVEDGVGMTAGKVYAVGPALLTEAIPNAEIHLPCVALKTSASGDKVQVGIEGVFEAWLKAGTLTAGDGIRSDNSEALAVCTESAATDNPGDQTADEIGFVVTAGSGGSKDSVIYLYGLPVLSIA